MQLTPYAQSLVDDLNKRSKFGDIGCQIFLDTHLPEGWRLLEKAPEAKEIVSVSNGEDDDDDE